RPAARKLVGGVTAVDYGPRRPAVPVYPISRRQREALLWIARGPTLAGAGREMGVTDNGVNGLLRLVYRK
ncbi:hypothetical protein KBZ21_54460, partial [Streptomyces sp. A73]|nr:hypothetical protein [Streptomyces sp. A73]